MSFLSLPIGLIRSCLLTLSVGLHLHAADWPCFRGPGGLGIASADARPPIQFSPTAHVAWRIDCPAGNSSPIVVGNSVFLTAASDRRLSLRCLDLATGQTRWQRDMDVPRTEEVHRTVGSPASATPVSDGHRVFVHFGSMGMAGFTLDGRELWRHPLPITETEYGASSSPVLAGGLLIQLIDQDSHSYLIALKTEDGSLAWRLERPDMRRGFGTPVLWPHHGRKDLVVPGTIFLTGLDPATGAERWRIPGLARITCTSPVFEGDRLVVASWTTGGDRGADRIELPAFDDVLKSADRDADGRLSLAELPAGAAQERRKHLDGNRDGFVDRSEWESMAAIFARVENQAFAVEPDTDGTLRETGVRWRFKRGLPYVASPLIHEQRVHLIKNGGFVTCLDARTGRPHYQEERLGGGGDYYASPILAGGHLYFASQRGVITVLRDSAEFQVVASNDLGEFIHASPVPVGNQLLVRTASHLYAFR